jgi:acyl dehydratase
MRGKYYEDIEIGESFVSASRTITETDVVMFAGLSGDYHPHHTDEEYAKKGPFGTRIAHGLLGLAIAGGLEIRCAFAEIAENAIATLGWKWDFVKPIIINDTVTLKIRVDSKRLTKKPSRGIVVFDEELINQRGEITEKGQHVLMVKCRPNA